VAVGVLRESGHFVDPTEEMVRSELLPDLYAAVSNSVNARNEAATLIVDGLIDDSFAASLNVFNLAASEEAARKAAEVVANVHGGANVVVGKPRYDFLVLSL
jgi:hypothetical protein